MKRITIILLLALTSAAAWARPATVMSPDGRLVVTVDNLRYSIAYDGECLVKDATLGLNLDDRPFPATARKTVRRNAVTEHIAAPFWRQASFDFSYNMLRLEFKGGFCLEWKVSDQGAAYRFTYGGKDELTVLDETVDVPIPFDAKAWVPYSSSEDKPYAISFESSYTVQRLSDGSPRPAFLPAVFEAPSGVKFAMLESDIRSYPGMFFRITDGAVKGEFAPYPSTFRRDGKDQRFVRGTCSFISRTTGPRTWPWRIFAVAERDNLLPENNLAYALAAPSRVEDSSWIRPGFSAWDWWNDWDIRGVDFEAGINQESYLYYIDFAAAHGLEYVILDEGWYPSDKGDLYDIQNGLDLRKLVSYAGEKGIRLILWTVFYSLDDRLEEYCRHFSELGIAGFKVDFLDRNDQLAVECAWRIAEMAAKYHLILDYHGVFPPMGISRTYPNILNFEAIKGLENARWASVEQFDMPEFDVTFPFIRQLSGYSDYTPGAMRNDAKADFRPNWHHSGSQGTRAHQVALYVVTDSPLTMLCDTPTNYYKEPETTAFIASFPRIYDETRCLKGEIGEYIVTARRAGEAWYVGGLTSWQERDVTLDMDFLPGGPDAKWKLSIFRDGINASRNAEDYVIGTLVTTPSSSIDIHMASGGGFALKLERL